MGRKTNKRQGAIRVDLANVYKVHLAVELFNHVLDLSPSHFGGNVHDNLLGQDGTWSGLNGRGLGGLGGDRVVGRHGGEVSFKFCSS